MKIDKYSAILGNAIGYNDMSGLTDKRPLANLPFDGKYRLIDFQLSSLANAGIRSVYGIFRGQNIRSVFDHIRSGREWGFHTLLSHYFLGFYNTLGEEEVADSDYYEQVLTYLKRSGSNQTIYMTCDILCNINLEEVIHLHNASKRNITVVYKKLPKTALSPANEILAIDEYDNIIGKKEASEGNDLEPMSVDIYVVNTPWLIEKLEEEVKQASPRKIRYLLRDLIVTEESLAFEYTGYLANICSVKSYYDANMDMLDPQKFYSLLYSNQKVYTRVKNEESTYFAKESQVRDSQFASGSVIKGKVERSIVSRGCLVEEGAQVLGSVVFPKVTIGNKAILEYAIVDKGVTIEPGVTIKGSPEQPIVVSKGLCVKEDMIL